MIDLLTQLEIIDAAAADEIVKALVWIIAALACALALIVISRRCKGRRTVWIAAVGALTLYAGTKPTWMFSYSGGLSDNGSYCTNDLIVARWSCQNQLLLDGYIISAAYRPLSVTNESWTALESAPVSARQKTWAVQNATNLLIRIAAQYVPPVVVHTNGVYRLGGVDRELNGSSRYVTMGIPIKACVEQLGLQTLTPTNKP